MMSQVQNDLLLKWLKKKPITNLMATMELGIGSPTRRICDLIEKGHIIDRNTKIKVKNRYGVMVPVKLYSYLGTKKYST